MNCLPVLHPEPHVYAVRILYVEVARVCAYSYLASIAALYAVQTMRPKAPPTQRSTSTKRVSVGGFDPVTTVPTLTPRRAHGLWVIFVCLDLKTTLPGVTRSDALTYRTRTSYAAARGS
jgi:hypothetical protein